MDGMSNGGGAPVTPQQIMAAVDAVAGQRCGKTAKVFGWLELAEIAGGIPTGRFVVGELRVYKDPAVPLVKVMADGVEVPVLCWRVQNTILVHPDRWDDFVRAIEESNRWSASG